MIPEAALLKVRWLEVHLLQPQHQGCWQVLKPFLTLMMTLSLAAHRLIPCAVVDPAPEPWRPSCMTD